MAITWTNALAELRSRTRDSASSQKITDADMLKKFNAAMVWLARELPTGEQWHASAITVTANTQDSTLSTTREWLTVERVRLASTGRSLAKITVEELNALRDQTTTADDATGEPEKFAIWEDQDESAVTVRIGFYPTPDETTTADVFGRVDPARPTTGADSIYLSAGALEVCYDRTLIDVLSTLPDDALRALGIDKGSLIPMAQDRMRANLRREHVRRGAIQTTGRVQRWVA